MILLGIWPGLFLLGGLGATVVPNVVFTVVTAAVFMTGVH